MGIPVKIRNQAELEDLKLLAICLLLVPLTWLVFLGWAPEYSMVGHDGITILIPNLVRLFAAQGQWTQALYRFESEGGVPVHGIVSTLPIYQISAYLGLSVTMASNLAVLLTQIIIGFLGCRTSYDLACFWLGRTIKPHWGAQLGLVWLIAFAPVLGWKIGYGHLVMLLGSLVYFSFFTLIIAYSVKRVTYSVLLTAFVAALHCLCLSGAQMIVYSVIFGAPIIIGFLASLTRDQFQQLLKASPIVLAVFLSALGVSLPKVVALVQHTLGSDATRSLDHQTITYSFITATLGDWLSSLSWTQAFLPDSRSMPSYHEINYPMGPPLLLALCFAPWKKWRWFGLGLLLSAAIAILFSMNFEPVSKILLAVIPVLRSFRVPERAILPFSMVLPVVAGAGILYQLEFRRQQLNGKNTILFWVVWAAVFAFLCFQPSIAREGVLWIITALIVLFIFKNHLRFKSLYFVALIALLGVGSVFEFKDRLLLPLLKTGDITEELIQYRKQALKQYPALASPLTRVMTSFGAPVFDNNAPYMMGFSTLDGYWFPQRRFLETITLLLSMKYEPTINNLKIIPSFPGYPILRMFYNICCNVSIDDQHQLHVEPQTPTLGPAWFSEGLAHLPSFYDLISGLRAIETVATDQLKAESLIRDRLLKEVWVNDQDEKIKLVPLSSFSTPACREAKVVQVLSKWESQKIEIQLQNVNASCPLTIAGNYSELLRATLTQNGGSTVQAPVFPAYGPLIGVLIPAGTTSVTVEAIFREPLWAKIGYYGGILLLVIWIFAHRRFYRSEATTQSN